jgi:hypothetical protein
VGVAGDGVVTGSDRAMTGSGVGCFCTETGVGEGFPESSSSRERESIFGTKTKAAAIKSTTTTAAMIIQTGSLPPPLPVDAVAESCKAEPHSGQRNSAPSATVMGFLV